jgi:triacylglycerol lipase
MLHPRKGRFPLNISYRYVKGFDGENDGLVGESSFKWGEKYTLLRTDGKRGISHGDMIDLNRENIKDFDVRAFYTDLVADLRKRGL